jgi:hypothetical protein
MKLSVIVVKPHFAVAVSKLRDHLALYYVTLGFYNLLQQNVLSHINLHAAPLGPCSLCLPGYRRRGLSS